MDIPGWVVIAVGIANILQIFSALALVVIGVVVALMAKQIIAMLTEIRSIVEDDVHKQIMPEVTATAKNVRTMSDDAAGATRSVTSTVNHVSHVVNSVTTKMESPVIKTVGVLTGVMAGARSLSHDKAAEKEKPKRRGGLIGILKK